ncbi:MAG: hypothetical protein FIB05_11625, partial [Betaproteobacteria bacterium]|nr:hypothetical protein [Betaproteobacteria bacterium]
MEAREPPHGRPAARRARGPLRTAAERGNDGRCEHRGRLPRQARPGRRRRASRHALHGRERDARSRGRAHPRLLQPLLAAQPRLRRALPLARGAARGVPGGNRRGGPEARGAQLRLGRNRLPQPLRDGARGAFGLAPVSRLVERVVRGPVAARSHRTEVAVGSPSIRRAAAALAAALALAAHAQGEFLTPPPALVLDGIPPIPAEIAAKTEAYTAFKPGRLLDWHPTKREVLVRIRKGDADQVHRVAEPGAAPEALTDQPEPVSDARYQPGAGSAIYFARGNGGDEAFRIHRLDPATKQSEPVSAEGRRAGMPRWNRRGDRFVYTTVPLDRANASRELKTIVHLAEAGAPEKARVLAELPGGGWYGFTFSPDDKRLAFIEAISAEESHLWLMDVATGKRRRLSPPTKGAPVHYADPQWAPDGRSLYVVSDRGSEYRRVAVIDAASGREKALATNLKFDVEDIAISAKAKRLAFVTNEAGAHVLRFLDLATRKETPRPALVQGVISDLRWRADGSEIAFTHASSRSPGDVFSYDLGAHRVT